MNLRYQSALQLQGRKSFYKTNCNAFTKLHQKQYNKKSNSPKNQDLIIRKSWDTVITFFLQKNMYHMETSQLICKTNQLTGFYMMSFY